MILSVPAVLGKPMSGFAPPFEGGIGRLPNIKDAQYYIIELNNLIENPFLSYQIFNTFASFNLLTTDVDRLVGFLIEESGAITRKETILFMFIGFLFFNPGVEQQITDYISSRGFMQSTNINEIKTSISDKWNSGIMRDTLPSKTSQITQDLGEIVQYLLNKNEIAPHLGNGEEEEDGELNIPVISPSKRRRGREDMLNTSSTDSQFNTVKQIAKRILKIAEKQPDLARQDVKWRNITRRAMFFLSTSWPEDPYSNPGDYGHPSCEKYYPVNEKACVCYICGGEIEANKNSKQSLKPYHWQIEHVMPFASALAYTGLAPAKQDIVIDDFIGLDNASDDSFIKWASETGSMAGRYFSEYAPSHKCCNQIKWDRLFLKFLRNGKTSYDELNFVLGKIHDNTTGNLLRTNSNCSGNIDINSKLRKNTKIMMKSEWVECRASYIKNNYLNEIIEDVKIHKSSTNGGLDDVIRFSTQMSRGLAGILEMIDEDTLSSFVKSTSINELISSDDFIWDGEPVDEDVWKQIEDFDSGIESAFPSKEVTTKNNKEMFVEFKNLSASSYFENESGDLIIIPTPDIINDLKLLLHNLEKYILTCKKFFSLHKYFNFNVNKRISQRKIDVIVKRETSEYLLNSLVYVKSDLSNANFQQCHIEILKRLRSKKVNIRSWIDISEWVSSNIYIEPPDVSKLTKLTDELTEEIKRQDDKSEAERFEKVVYTDRIRRWKRVNGRLFRI